MDHDGRRDPEAGKEADTERDDGKNGKNPPKRSPDLPERHEAECVFAFFYHSISAMSAGLSFKYIFSTLPLRTRMTRSAMAVMA